MFRWYTELTRGERRTFWGCFGGWGLDAMDLSLFSFLMPALIAAWGLTRGDAGLLGTAALLSSAIGGWIGGVLSDRYGRVRIMQFTILWYATFTFLSGFTTSFDQLMVARILQGLGFGGEWAAGAVLMGEIIQARHRGKAVGCVQSAYAVGWGIASIVSSVLLTTLPAEYAWRAVFFVGVLPALLVIYIRRYVEEPSVSVLARAAAARAGESVGLFTIFRPEILRTTVLTSMLALGLQGGSYAVNVWLPTFLTTVRHMSAAGTGSSVLIVTFGAFCGYIVGAYLADGAGRRVVFLSYSVGALAVITTYMFVPLGDVTLRILGFPLGFFGTGVYAAFGPFFTELFPTRMRATGQSFSYNFGRSTGAILVAVVGWLAQMMPLSAAIGIIALSGYTLAIVATLLLPETKGMELTAYSVVQTASEVKHAA